MAISTQQVSATLRRAGWMPSQPTARHPEGIHVKSGGWPNKRVRVAVEIDTPGYREREIPEMMHALNRVGYTCTWNYGDISFYVEKDEG